MCVWLLKDEALRVQSCSEVSGNSSSCVYDGNLLHNLMQHEKILVLDRRQFVLWNVHSEVTTTRTAGAGAGAGAVASAAAAAVDVELPYN